jgi:hypothetical protein
MCFKIKTRIYSCGVIKWETLILGNALAVSSELYGIETWTGTTGYKNVLQTVRIESLRSIIGATD